MAESNSRKRWKLYTDEVKERHTSHWDWDYMSREELDELARHNAEQPPPVRPEPEPAAASKLSPQTLGWLVLVVGLVVAAVIALL